MEGGACCRQGKPGAGRAGRHPQLIAACACIIRSRFLAAYYCFSRFNSTSVEYYAYGLDDNKTGGACGWAALVAQVAKHNDAQTCGTMPAGLRCTTGHATCPSLHGF